ncbi:MAG TPA: hypothetical protein VEU30_17345 [Thermoanaerobaculia bacterium]|nr:hypothetical protein [Thermoanaerobaculia bacterium]
MTTLNGTWRHANETADDLIVFGEDALLLGHDWYSFEEDGERLFILPSEAEIVVPYRCDGDTLRLDVDGVVSVWSRVGNV